MDESPWMKLDSSAKKDKIDGIDFFSLTIYSVRIIEHAFLNKDGRRFE